MQLSAIIEALLVASEEPLPSSEIARIIRARVAEAEDALAAENEIEKNSNEDPEATPKDLPEELAALADINDDLVTAAIVELNRQYETSGRAFLCTERAKGWKIYTHPDYAAFVRQLFPDRKPSRLSGPAMETLAIIAYRQPVTKASIEAVRGVSCDGMLQKLLDRELIKIGGRADLPGRPLLYDTTDLFFEHFGVKSVDELPNSAELRTIKLPEPEPETEAAESDAAISDQNDEPTSEDIEQQLALTSAGIPNVNEPSETTSTDDAQDSEDR